MAEEREPLGLALVVCDGIHTDPGTGKKTLLGLFSTVVGPQFPLVLQQLFIYAAVTDCLGPTSFEIRIVDVNEERQPVFSGGGAIHCDDPLAVQDFVFYLAGATFPEPGEYRVQLHAGGSPVMERRLMAILVQPETIRGVEYD